MRILTIFILLYSTFSSIFGQVCPNPTVPCSSLNSKTLSQCGDYFSFEAPINDTPCLDGGQNVNYGCTNVRPINQSWFVITVNIVNKSQLDFTFNNSNGNDLNGVIWGPINSDYSNTCDILSNAPISCDFDNGQPNLTIQNPVVGQKYLLMINNNVNSATTINMVQPENDGGHVDFCRYIPTTFTCTLPTLTFDGNRIVKTTTTTDIVLNFTGSGPWFYWRGSYEYRADNPQTILTEYVTQSYDLNISRVRNSCGVGVVNGSGTIRAINNSVGLRACFPFNGKVDSEFGLSETKLFGANFSADRNGNLNNSLEFDGIDDYISFTDKELPSDKFTTSAWVKAAPNVPANSIQKIFSLGQAGKDHFIALINNASTNNQPKWVVRYFNEYQEERIIMTEATIDQWVHLCVVKGNEYLKLYVNGVYSQNLTTWDDKYPLWYFNNLGRVGCGVNNQDFFKGKIDEVKYISGELTNAQITDLYKSTNCELKLCDNIPVLTLNSENVSQLSPYSTYSLPVMLSGVLPIMISVNGELPNYYYSAGQTSLRLNAFDGVKNIKSVKYISNECGTGKIIGEANISITPEFAACFPFNGNAFNEITQESAYSTATTTTDRFNQPNRAYQFDGIDDYVQFRVPVNSMSNSTFSAWIYPTEITSTARTIFYMGSTLVYALLISKNANNQTVMTFQNGTLGNNSSTVVNLNQNQWYHLALTFKNATLGIYLNGELVKFITITNEIYQSIYDSFYLGLLSHSSYARFKGKIDDVKFFNGYLKPHQIKELYFSTNECKYSICQTPTVNLDTTFEGDYYEFSAIDLNPNSYGPWIVTTSITPGIFTVRTTETSRPFMRLPLLLKSGTNNFQINHIRNHCGIGSVTGTTKLIVFSKQINCYPFSGNTEDNLGNYDGVNNGGVLTTDRFSNENMAYEFDGNTSNISFSQSLLPEQEYSVSFWCMPYQQNNATNTLLEFGSGNKYQRFSYKSKKFEYVSSAYNYGLNTILTTEEFNENSWYFISLVRIYNTMKLYVNGELKGSQQTVDSQTTSIGGLIGRGTIANTGFKGKIDDMRIFLGALNDGEVRQIYQNTASNCSFIKCPEEMFPLGVISSDKNIIANTKIESKNVLQVNSNTIFNAGKNILLKPGFSTENGAKFQAKIQGCAN